MRNRISNLTDGQRFIEMNNSLTKGIQSYNFRLICERCVRLMFDKRTVNLFLIIRLEFLLNIQNVCVVNQKKMQFSMYLISI